MQRFNVKHAARRWKPTTRVATAHTLMAVMNRSLRNAAGNLCLKSSTIKGVCCFRYFGAGPPLFGVLLLNFVLRRTKATAMKTKFPTIDTQNRMYG